MSAAHWRQKLLVKRCCAMFNIKILVQFAVGGCSCLGQSTLLDNDIQTSSNPLGNCNSVLGPDQGDQGRYLVRC